MNYKNDIKGGGIIDYAKKGIQWVQDHKSDIRKIRLAWSPIILSLAGTNPEIFASLNAINSYLDKMGYGNNKSIKDEMVLYMKHKKKKMKSKKK